MVSEYLPKSKSVFFAKPNYLLFGKQMPSEAGFVASDGIAATPPAGRLFLPARFRFGVCRKLIPKKIFDKRP
ncbi:hypothetical protein EEE08_02860 [Neisseria gonorrhoeae]|nr:hypothetical protein [Neisseria meningitidis]MBG8827026.1 hypothetical protein [Neisseria meningitidis]ROV08272.1 hypothetical protein EGP35_07605 [Neisseria gonorrhoeae]ROV10734.1 hypothetical protein EGO80_08205 [Neisseria gonorrhoeae]ROV40392.1 hypothetical protein EGT54_06460 [Neisseria gonorrhoeae]